MSPNSSASLYMPQTYSFLSPETFETLVEGYINQLHIRKRNKALITQQLANDCLMVLTNPENTAIFNPKFRWWVRKHFVFTVVGELRILLDKKNGKPVCVREQLYDKVCYFHHIIGHGGRDKTFAAITKSYSKVPAELVSLFTKNCQTCLGVRKYSKNKRPILNENEYPQHHPHQHHQCQQQQQQQLQQQQLTCDTTGGYSSSSITAPANTQYHPQQHQHYHGMVNQPEQGTITPISPLLHPSSSGFFGQSNNQYSHHHHPHQQQHLASGYNHSTHQLIQQHQTQQMHSAAMQAHHMGMSMNISLAEMSLGNTHTGGAMNSMPGLGHIGANGHHQLHGNISAMSSSGSTPTALVKMDPSVVHHYDSSSMASALLSMGQQSQYQHASNASHQTATGALVSPTELNDQSHHHIQAVSSQYNHDQLGAIGVSANSNSASDDATSVSQYSPLMDQSYQTVQSQVQQQQYAYQQYHQFQSNDYSAQAYAINDPQQQHQLQSTFSAALSLSSMPLIQPQQQLQSHHSYDQHSQFQQHQPQHDYTGQQQLQESSPVLTQNQMFQKQIQQEQQRFHQQQQQLMASVSTSSSSASTNNATAAITIDALPPSLNLGVLSSSSLSVPDSSLSIAAIIASSPTLPSMAPSLGCSIETPTPMSTVSTPPQSASVGSSNGNNTTAAAAAMVSSLLEHEPKNPHTTTSSLISSAQGL